MLSQSFKYQNYDHEYSIHWSNSNPGVINNSRQKNMSAVLHLMLILIGNIENPYPFQIFVY